MFRTNYYRNQYYSIFSFWGFFSQLLLLSNNFDRYNFLIKFYLLNKPTNQLRKFLLNQLLVQWVKITFRGKGFRVRKFKKSKKMTFNFGCSHWTKLFFNSYFFFSIKIRRQNYLLFSLFTSLVDLKHVISNVKLMNRYTKRGLRLKKQIIKKRFGKVSQVVSSLHF